MPVATCDLNTLIKGQRCYACLPQKVNQAAMVYWLEQTRAKLAGVTPLTANQLLGASKCLECFPTNDVCDALDAFVAQQGAIGVGVAGASTITIAQIRAAINLLSNMSLDDLRTIEIATRCALNAFLFVS